MTNSEKFKAIVDGSNRILITSHISPDPDAIASILLLGRTLKTNYQNKDIEMVLEEEPVRDLSFLAGFSGIKFVPLFSTMQELKPELLVMLDAMNFDRISRSDDDKIRHLAEELNLKLAIIDHHTQAGLEANDIYINNQLPATAQEVYDLLFIKLKLKKPADYAETALLGIVSDSARFKYDNPRHKETFRIVDQLLEDGASIEKLENRLDRYTKPQMAVLSNLAKNITDSGEGYSFSFIDDDLDISDPQSYKMACEIFTSEYLRKFEANLWGFIVYREITAGKKTYSVSFRSANGVKDVAALAASLGGGGHKAAAGAKKIQSKSVRDAVNKVIAVIQRLES